MREAIDLYRTGPRLAIEQPPRGAGGVAAAVAPRLRFQKFTCDLATARTESAEALAGNFLMLLGVGTIRVRFDDSTATQLELSAEKFIGPISFDRLYLEWDAQAGGSVDIVYGDDPTGLFVMR